MRLKQLLTNKKIVIVVLALLLALIVGIAILVNPNSEETGGKDADTKTEQNIEGEDSQDDKEETDASKEEEDTGNESSGMEVLEPDEIAPEDSSDASGSWVDEPDSNTQTGNSNTTDKVDDNTPSDKPNETDKEEDGDELGKDILKDDINWGNIY